MGYNRKVGAGRKPVLEIEIIFIEEEIYYGFLKQNEGNSKTGHEDHCTAGRF
jgi:hypothetical protein